MNDVKRLKLDLTSESINRSIRLKKSMLKEVEALTARINKKIVGPPVSVNKVITHFIRICLDTYNKEGIALTTGGDWEMFDRI
jgi:uncharacterized membrane protein affecting hemolysin expression